MAQNDFRDYCRGNKNAVSYQVYSEIAFGYCKFLIEKVLDGNEVSLPKRFGSLHVKGIKPRRTKDGTIHHPINWKETIKYWNKYPEKKAKRVTIKYLNPHTDGYTYSIRWRKAGAIIENKSVYFFKLARRNKALLKETICSGKEFLNRK